MSINGSAQEIKTISYNLKLTEDAASALMQICQNPNPDDCHDHKLTKEMVFTLLNNAGCSV